MFRTKKIDELDIDELIVLQKLVYKTILKIIKSLTLTESLYICGFLEAYYEERLPENIIPCEIKALIM